MNDNTVGEKYAMENGYYYEYLDAVNEDDDLSWLRE